MIRAIELVSRESLEAAKAACAQAGCLPLDYVSALDELPSVAEMLSDDSWTRDLLNEEFALGTQCSTEPLFV